jgi:hypothetical protein
MLHPVGIVENGQELQFRSADDVLGLLTELLPLLRKQLTSQASGLCQLLGRDDLTSESFMNGLLQRRAAKFVHGGPRVFKTKVDCCSTVNSRLTIRSVWAGLRKLDFGCVRVEKIATYDICDK